MAKLRHARYFAAFCPFSGNPVLMALPLPLFLQIRLRMTLLYFKNLTQQQKKTTVLRHGTFLSEKNYGLFRTMLYQVDGFYVEVYFTPFSRDAAWYRSFDSTKSLQPYLQQIDISSLLQDVSLSS
ncbi:MAG: hypothetical protein JWP27_303 [Flaviaesturariibacter sp.]|nr:hypothetical protein [Flaviaesturariibacter sp.]